MSKLLALICIVFFTGLHAGEESVVPKKYQTVYDLYLTPEKAYQMKQTSPDNLLFIDVRTRPEVKYTGIADSIDAHIPIRFIRTDFAWSDKSSTYRTTRNLHFSSDVELLLSLRGKDKSTPIILMCQSGSRVPYAAKVLSEAGFETVYTVYEGFEGKKAKSGPNLGKRLVNGWKNAGLPWSYKLDKQKMYFNFDSSLDQQ